MFKKAQKPKKGPKPGSRQRCQCGCGEISTDWYYVFMQGAKRVLNKPCYERLQAKALRHSSDDDDELENPAKLDDERDAELDQI